MREYFDQKLWGAGRACKCWKSFFGFAAVFFILAAGVSLLDAGNDSWLACNLHWNPVLVALGCALCGILLALANWRLGIRYLQILNLLGLAPVRHTSRINGQCRIWCVPPEEKDLPKPGNVRMVLSPGGALVGEARAEIAHSGKLVLTMLDDAAAPRGSLVCLFPPHTRPRQMPPRTSRKHIARFQFYSPLTAHSQEYDP